MFNPKNVTLFLALFITHLSNSNIYSNVVELSSGRDVEANGEFIGREAINLSAGGCLRGNGLLKSPVINIDVEKFEFTGTIECDKACNIVTRYRFNEKMFKRRGAGKFNITVVPPTEKKPEKEFDVKGFKFTFVGSKNIGLADAIVNNNAQEIEKYLKETKELEKDKHLLMAFMLLSGFSNNVELAEKFIKLGADVNAQDSDIQSPLMMAVHLEASNFVRTLVHAGANPNVTNNNGVPALVYAASGNDLATIKALLESTAIEINKTNRNKQTALMFAVHNGNSEIVRTLLKARADVDTKDVYQNTAHKIAQNKGLSIILELLREQHLQ